MATLVASQAAKGAPSAIVAGVCWCSCLASAIVAIVFSIRCSKDVQTVRKDAKADKKGMYKDCGITGAMWCLFIIAFLCWANAALTALQKMVS